MSKPLEYNYEEFVAFLLLYASHVDMEFSVEEKDNILEKISEKNFEKIYADFNGMSDYETLQTILNYKGVYYPTPDRKKELMDKVKALFFADGDYSVMEREMMHFLEKLM